ncbi:MAG: dTDP-glucose 4,6-dehydratase [Bacteroidales bacterium]|nr:dTDP-glucose 4,6-dehydratase [Bacteroidales bacterium]MDD4671435.1 dTDP-glucose 4,6-dehydratase [Bacteroidales bacterium]MDY0347530.1 dTDP-glucose 4,6-dehydratase [Tenuifilaceae bacterium]
MKNLLITGGAGFIGSHLVRRFVTKYPKINIINMDCLTYAGNLNNLKDVESQPNYRFVKVNICDEEAVNQVFAEHKIDGVIHLAAESHVDRSITDPMSFIKTNIEGTVVLLNAARKQWGNNFENKLFYHISTDEVYGSLGDEGLFTESTPYDPRSPYSASKASADFLVRAYHHTYNLPVVISNCSNNYGSHQFPEKLIPLIISNIKQNKALPVYGKGLNVRDWLYVEDHAAAIDTIFHKGKLGETYNIGGNNEWKNIDLVKLLCRIMDEKLGRNVGESEKLITFVTDRAGHDLRYAIDSSKITNGLGWSPQVSFEEGLEKTVSWYLANSQWVSEVISGEYANYYKQQYENR